MGVRWAGNAFGPDPWINGFGKSGVFNQPARFTGIVIQAFSWACSLNPALIHTENKARRGFLVERLFIDEGIQTELQGLFQSLKAGIFR